MCKDKNKLSKIQREEESKPYETSFFQDNDIKNTGKVVSLQKPIIYENGQ